MNGAAPPPDRSAFMRLIGAAQVPAPPGKVHVRLPHMREELLNQLPAAHGGVIMTLLDSVMSRACALQPGAPSQTAVTVEMTSRFHRPGRGALLAEGWVVHSTRSLCSCAAPIRRMKALRSTSGGAPLMRRAPHAPCCAR